MPEFITDGALMQCDKGVAPSKLTVTSQQGCLIAGKPQATEKDKQAGANIAPFGVCSVTQKSCMPQPTAWVKAGPYTIDGVKELTTDSFCMCGLGGKIQFLQSGNSGFVKLKYAAGAGEHGPMAGLRGDNGDDDKPKVKGKIYFARPSQSVLNEYLQLSHFPIEKYAKMTSYYKGIEKIVESQYEYDIYVFYFLSCFENSVGEYENGVSFDLIGDKHSLGIEGKTFGILNNMNDAVEMRNKDYFVNHHCNIQDMEKSFNDDKSVILVGIAQQFLFPYPPYIDEETSKKLSSDSSKLSVFRRNVLLQGSECIIHEMWCHAIRYIKGPKLSSKEEHYQYHGIYSEFSPSTLEKEKYKKTIMEKVVKELENAIPYVF